MMNRYDFQIKYSFFDNHYLILNENKNQTILKNHYLTIFLQIFISLKRHLKFTTLCNYLIVRSRK